MLQSRHCPWGCTPLFIITGASGVGKTTIIPELRKILPDMCVFDVDLLQDSAGDWQTIRNNWLRIARSIAVQGRLTILCGTMMPWDVEKCDCYNYFSVRYLCLHCDDETRENRLRKRGWGDDMIEEHRTFAQWLISNAESAYHPAMPVVDTSTENPNEIARVVGEWVTNFSGVEDTFNGSGSSSTLRY